jgi:hypothetical protein
LVILIWWSIPVLGSSSFNLIYPWVYSISHLPWL